MASNFICWYHQELMLLILAEGIHLIALAAIATMVKLMWLQSIKGETSTIYLPLIIYGSDAIQSQSSGKVSHRRSKSAISCESESRILSQESPQWNLSSSYHIYPSSDIWHSHRSKQGNIFIFPKQPAGKRACSVCVWKRDKREGKE